ncbi:MAG TPA: DUF1924 domain-containing protein [Gallionellaceae bacterium]
MKTATTAIALLCLALVPLARAETPADMLARYSAEAARMTPGFSPSAERGRAFFNRDWGVSQKMPACESCHGKNLRAEGKHIITGKRIAPFSPQANPERFTSVTKVEKWFRRNCTEVVGRECSAAEKADFIQFVMQ